MVLNRSEACESATSQSPAPGGPNPVDVEQEAERTTATVVAFPPTASVGGRSSSWRMPSSGGIEAGSFLPWDIIPFLVLVKMGTMEPMTGVVKRVEGSLVPGSVRCDVLWLSDCHVRSIVCIVFVTPRSIGKMPNAPSVCVLLFCFVLRCELTWSSCLVVSSCVLQAVGCLARAPAVMPRMLSCDPCW